MCNMALIDYIDTKKTTVSILRDWLDQNWKIEQGERDIREIERRMTMATSYSNSEPVKGGGNRAEEAMCAAIDKKTVIEHGIKLAEEYRKEIMPAWNRLTDGERFCLTARFVDYSEQNGIELIMRKFSISKTEAYNRSNAALDRLSKLIFWK